MYPNKKSVKQTIFIVSILLVGIISKSKSYTSQKKIEAKATTENGRNVILYNDGTWEYWELQKKQTQHK